MTPNKSYALKSALSDAFELPKEIMLNLPRVVIIGHSQMLIENHKGIIEYTPQKIRLNSIIGIVKIEGIGMNLKNIAIDDIIVTGRIKTVNFL